MSSILTVRLNDETKHRATEILKREGYSPSSAVQSLFEYVIKHDTLPFPEERKLSREEIHERVAAFDAVHTKQPLTLSDHEIKAARIKERHGIDA